MDEFELTDPEGWIDTFRTGSFYKPEKQPDGSTIHFLQVTAEEDLEQVVRVWNAEGRPELLIDKDHLSYQNTSTTESMGWVTDMRVRDGHLHLKVRWSGDGLHAVKNGVYRKCSAVFDVYTEEGQPATAGRSAKEMKRVRPLRVDSAALTNRPNVSGLQLISHRTGEPPAPNPDTKKTMDLKPLAAALGLPETASAEEITAETIRVKNRADTSTKAATDEALERFKAVIPAGQEEFFRANLVSNRAGTLAVLEGMKATAKPPVDTARVHNRDAGQTKENPLGKDGGEDGKTRLTGRALQSAQQDAVQLVKNRREGMSALDALATAKAENPDLFPQA